MGAEILVLVTCTNRKTVPPSSALRLRAVQGESILARAAVWRERLEAATGEAVPAQTLYAGDHWQVVRSLGESARGRNLGLQTLICSAGYGLLLLDTAIHSYGATFSLNEADSVTQGARKGAASNTRRAWWRELGAWMGPAPEAPRSITALLSRHKNITLLIAVSPPYLDAIAADLEDAIASTDPERVAIFSAGTDSHPTFGQNLIPCDARLQKLLGGARGSLNIRCLRYAIEHVPVQQLVVADLRRHFTRLLARQPELETPQRTPLSDAEVSAFICQALGENPQARPSPLLQRLRNSGRACEHTRFSTLFRVVAGEGRHG